MIDVETLKNRVYYSDNLKLLSNIPNKSIDLIYSDILYGTGKDFGQYKDNLWKTMEEMKAFYRPRLEEMKRILKDTGVIYLQCDYCISHYFKILLDEIFGIKNFRNEIIWYYNSAPRKKKDFGKRHDTIFRYSVTDKYYFNEDSELIRVPYAESAPRGYAKEKYYNPKGKVMDDVWHIKMIGQNDKTERCGYPTQKPLELVKKIIDSSCPEDGIVADFFAGSGTVGVACQELNRKYLLCDNSEEAFKTIQLRLKNSDTYYDDTFCKQKDEN